MSDERLVLGIGATKAGTSWLNRYLASHPGCHFRGIKEIHYFDQREIQGAVWKYRAMESNLEKLRAKRARGVKPEVVENLDYLIAENEDWIATFGDGHASEQEYLAFLRRGAKHGDLCGEVTPAYSLMSQPVLKQMATLTKDVRFVYLLRDPVDRLWSHIRMLASRVKDSDFSLGQLAEGIAMKFLNGKRDDIAGRGDYKATLERLNAVVAPKNLHVAFYENLFSRAAVERITTFLGLHPHPANFDRFFNKGKPVTLNDTLKARFREVLAEQYHYVRAMFQGDIPARWQENMARI